MRERVGGSLRDVTVKRDGQVLVDGELAGYVRGEPRRWAWIGTGTSGGPGFYFTKREAASACAADYARFLPEQTD